MIDNNLSWHSHINYMCKTISKKVYQLCRIKHFLSPHARRLFFHAHILSCISYCSIPFDSASENATKPLVRIYKSATKAVQLKSSSLTTSDYKDLDIFTLKLTFAKNKAILMQKIALGTVPLTLQSKFQRFIRQHGKLQVPVPRLDLFKSSLHYSGSILWNALPQTVRSSNSIPVFKNRLKRHFKPIEWIQAFCNHNMTLWYRWSTDAFWVFGGCCFLCSFLFVCLFLFAWFLFCCCCCCFCSYFLICEYLCTNVWIL